MSWELQPELEPGNLQRGLPRANSTRFPASQNRETRALPRGTSRRGAESPRPPEVPLTRNLIRTRGLRAHERGSAWSACPTGPGTRGRRRGDIHTMPGIASWDVAKNAQSAARSHGPAPFGENFSPILRRSDDSGFPGRNGKMCFINKFSYLKASDAIGLVGIVVALLNGCKQQLTRENDPLLRRPTERHKRTSPKRRIASPGRVRGSEEKVFHLDIGNRAGKHLLSTNKRQIRSEIFRRVA